MIPGFVKCDGGGAAAGRKGDTGAKGGGFRDRVCVGHRREAKRLYVTWKRLLPQLSVGAFPRTAAFRS